MRLASVFRKTNTLTLSTHSTLPHTVTHENGETIGLAVLAGFVVFFLFDILVRSTHDHDHSHHHHDKDDEHCQNKNFSAVVLNLAADALHNFTDGIAIGASFAGSTYDSSLPLAAQVQTLLKSKGGLASLAVLFHEIPHELGDYSILVSAGKTKKEAIMLQFSTAIAAYCGTFVGLGLFDTVQNIFGSEIMVPFTAGGFVYLAAVTILPGLLEEKVCKKARAFQVMALLGGIGFMYVVAMLEHASGGCSHDHGHSGHSHGMEHSHSHHSHEHHANEHHNIDHHSHNYMHEEEFDIDPAKLKDLLEEEETHHHSHEHHGHTHHDHHSHELKKEEEEDHHHDESHHHSHGHNTHGEL